MPDVQNKGTLLDPELVKDLINKVRGKSSVAKLAKQVPVSFNGNKEFTFSMDSEIDIVAEGGAKSHGGIKVAPVTIVPVKFEYGARISDEFMSATEDEQIDTLTAFNDGFSMKLARGLDLASMHGVNPRTTVLSNVLNGNDFDHKIKTFVEYNESTPDDNLNDAIAAVSGADGDVNGIAMSPSFGTSMSRVKVNGVRQYPEFNFGGKPNVFYGNGLDINRTVSDMDVSDQESYAYVGDFANSFKWGFAKQMPMDIIEYGCPDNDTAAGDLKGHGQIYIRIEAYLGWGILIPESFSKIRTKKV